VTGLSVLSFLDSGTRNLRVTLGRLGRWHRKTSCSLDAGKIALVADDAGPGVEEIGGGEWAAMKEGSVPASNSPCSAPKPSSKPTPVHHSRPSHVHFFELNPNPQPSTLNPQPSTLNPQPSTLNPQPQAPLFDNECRNSRISR